MEETSHVSGGITAAGAAVASGERKVVRASLEGTVDCGGWWPGWLGLCECQCGGPPYPG